jgi:cell division protein ZapA
MTTRPVPPSERAVTLDVTLLGRDYKVACNEGERAELMDAVAFLERRLQEVRAAGKVNGAERIAVMVALNLAHELLRARAMPATGQPSPAPSAPIDALAARRRIASMHAVIDSALAGQERLP